MPTLQIHAALIYSSCRQGWKANPWKESVVKKVIVLIPAMIAVIATGCASVQAKLASAPEAASVRLSKGTVKVYKFGDIVLHAYKTGDALSDESFILETGKNLVAIESPVFHSNLKELAEYAKGLKKPLTDILLANHPNGVDYYDGVDLHLTGSVVSALAPGGATKGLIDNFTVAFGADFDASIPAVKANIKPGKVTIGGIDFVITETATAYDIEIPAINCVYTHMLGANVHSIMVSPAQMDSMIITLESYKQKGYALVLSGHNEPEKLSDVDVKIAYVKKAKELAAGNKTADGFIAAMKAAFPGYFGDNYLGMTAAALFPVSK
jgi:hypothetical protein